jgi:hypothetical protein
MKILSIDVGIRNLSFCLFDMKDADKNTLSVLKWDNIDLTEKTNNRCIFVSEKDNEGLCDKPAKFVKDGKCYCLKHSKKLNFLQPASDLALPFLNKQKVQSLIEIADKYKVKYETPYKKAGLIAQLTEFAQTHCFAKIDKVNASKIDLVTIGRNIEHKFGEILGEHLPTIETIIIENQIGPIANKMKTIQGMLAQYFIMKNNNISVDFISATNKLKDFMPTSTSENTNKSLNSDKSLKPEKMDYKQRKKLGIQTCLNFVDTDHRFTTWGAFLHKHQKKDDLSDCFLQGMWYIKHKIS